MSLQIDWSGLNPSWASTICEVLNTHLSQAELPGFLRSVEVLHLDLGSIPPNVTIKDIEDPSDVFYESDIEEELHAEVLPSENVRENLGRGTPDTDALQAAPNVAAERSRQRRVDQVSISTSGIAHDGSITDGIENASVTSEPPPYVEHPSHRSTFSASGWEGMNLPYFHSAFAPSNNGIVSASGLSTPRPRFLGWSNTFLPTEAFVPEHSNSHCVEPFANSCHPQGEAANRVSKKAVNSNDTQLKIQFTYSGDILVKLQVELALNYPSPFFVTLPVTMSISEVNIDALAIIAYIEEKIHVSLLESSENPLKSFKIKSHIGEQDKVSLVDLEKVEHFMLRELQSIIERELIYPSFYTFIL